MRILLFVPVVSLVLSADAIAQQKGQEQQPVPKLESADAPDPANPEKQILLDELVDQLSSPRFTIRLQAARKLKTAGAEGVETLRRVTQTGTKEAASQALQILQEHMANGNNEMLQNAAKNALEQISGDEKNPSSSEAKGILNKAANAQATQNQQNRRFPMIIPRNVQAAAMRVQVQNNNGKLRIQVEKNGQKTAITEEKDGIKVEKKDANGKSTKETYKTIEEMKEKDKDAHQLFQQYKKVGGGLKLQFKGNGIPLQFNVRPKKIPNLNPDAPNDGAPQNLENMQRQTLKRHREMMELQLRKMQEDILSKVPKEHRQQLEDEFKKQQKIMNQPLLEIEQKLKQRTPQKGQPKVPVEIPAPAEKKPSQVEAIEQKLIET